MLGISSSSSCRKWFKKLEILPIPSLRIYSVMLFVVDSVHSLKLIPLFTRLIQDIRIIYPPLRLGMLLYREVLPTCSAVKLFNKLVPRILELKNDKTISTFALRKYLLTCFL